MFAPTTWKLCHPESNLCLTRGLFFLVLQDRDPIKQPVPSLGDGSCHVNNDLRSNSICRHPGPASERTATQICLIHWLGWRHRWGETDGEERHKYNSRVLDHAKRTDTSSKASTPDSSTGNFDPSEAEREKIISLDSERAEGNQRGEATLFVRDAGSETGRRRKRRRGSRKKATL